MEELISLTISKLSLDLVFTSRLSADGQSCLLVHNFTFLNIKIIGLFIYHLETHLLFLNVYDRLHDIKTYAYYSIVSLKSDGQSCILVHNFT